MENGFARTCLSDTDIHALYENTGSLVFGRIFRTCTINDIIGCVLMNKIHQIVLPYRVCVYYVLDCVI